MIVSDDEVIGYLDGEEIRIIDGQIAIGYKEEELEQISDIDTEVLEDAD